MFCENCGAQSKDDAAFCTKCGTKHRTPAPPPIPQEVKPAPAPEASDPPPDESDPADDMVSLQIIPSPIDPVTVDTTRLYLSAFYHHEYESLRIGLMAEGSTGEVYVFAVVRRGFIPTFRDIVTAHFPNTEFHEVIQKPQARSATMVRHFYKTESPVYRLNCLTDFQPDPYAVLVNAFAALRPKEIALYAVIFLRIEQAAEALQRVGVGLATLDDAIAEHPERRGPAITGNMAEFEKKCAGDLWSAVLELTVYGSKETADAVTKAFEQFAARFANKRTRIVPVEPEKEAGGRPNFLGMAAVIGTDELAGLVHFPHKSLQHPALLRVNATHKPPPAILTKEGIALGIRKHRGETITVRIPPEERTRHVYVIGKSGSGKSTLLANLIRQDIEQGNGVGVIDPHGDLCEELLHFIPESRIEDTIYFNAADRAAPIALNVMSAANEEEVGMLADDLLVTFRRLSESWGARMESILYFVFHTLLRIENTTLLDVRTILLDEGARGKMLSKIDFPPIQEFWRQEFVTYPRDAAQPILSRMAKFALSNTLYGILSQPQSRLNFYDVIQNKKIFLANLSQGKIGTDTSQLLGSLLVSQIQLATMRRANLSKEEREPFYLYVDEFQHFTTSAFDKILSEARKYKLCLTLAHQYISQLGDQVRSSILNNAGTIIMFPLGLQDAGYLRSELGTFTPEDLTNLSFQEHEVLCRPPTKSSDTFKFQTLPPPRIPERSFAREVVEHTQKTYSTVRQREETTPPVPVVPSAEVPVPPTVPRRPAAAPTPDLLTARERIVLYVKMAEYLSTQQIIELAYAHVSLSAQATAASRDLRQLVETGDLNVQPFGRGNIYYTGRTCNPTTHNLALRDLFVKILKSGYDIAEVSFTLDLKTILPDLFVSFPVSGGEPLKTLWEYDTGTEPTAEILKKVARYQSYPEFSPIICVVRDHARLAQLQSALPNSPLWFAVISEFTTLKDAAFHRTGATSPCPLFDDAASAAAISS